MPVKPRSMGSSSIARPFAAAALRKQAGGNVGAEAWRNFCRKRGIEVPHPRQQAQCRGGIGRAAANARRDGQLLVESKSDTPVETPQLS